MSVQSKIPYISLRDIVVATLDGYSIRFEKGKPVDVPNFKNVINAVNAAGCVPYIDGDEKIAPVTRTFEHVTDEQSAARADAIRLAILAIVDRDLPVDFTRAGAPQTRSLETITGFDKISNAERDEAWKSYKTSLTE